MLHMGRSAEQASSDSCGSLEMLDDYISGVEQLWPHRETGYRKRFFTEGMAAQSRQRIWGWSLPAGMSCSAGTRTGKAWQRVGITTACGSATFQLQLQDLLTPQRKSSSADKQELGLLQASLKFSFIPYQDELKLQINKLLRKLWSSKFDSSWSQRYSSEMAQLCLLCYFPGMLTKG